MRILKIDDSVPVKRCLFSNPAASQPCYNKDEQVCDFLKQTINICGIYEDELQNVQPDVNGVLKWTRKDRKD